MITPSIPQIYWLSIAVQKIICGINGLIVNVKRHTAIHYVISIYKIRQNLFVNKNCLCVWVEYVGSSIASGACFARVKYTEQYLCLRLVNRIFNNLWRYGRSVVGCHDSVHDSMMDY